MFESSDIAQCHLLSVPYEKVGQNQPGCFPANMIAFSGLFEGEGWQSMVLAVLSMVFGSDFSFR